MWGSGGLLEAPSSMTCCEKNSRNVCQPDMGHSLLTTRHRNGQSATEVDPEHFAEPSWGESTTPSWSILLECGMEPFRFNWFRATMRFYNSLTTCNSLLLKK
eukprot:1154729-Pelagomonas_calceolata.AAC.1